MKRQKFDCGELVRHVEGYCARVVHSFEETIEIENARGSRFTSPTKFWVSAVPICVEDVLACAIASTRTEDV